MVNIANFVVDFQLKVAVQFYRNNYYVTGLEGSLLNTECRQSSDAAYCDILSGSKLY